MTQLLSRTAFKTAVFKRDNHTCKFCSQPAVDAHHILDRQLWDNGGYYLENGIAVCEEHHLECERTLLPLNTIYQLLPHTSRPHPATLPNTTLDKWGNPYTPQGYRLRGPMFWTDGVQAILPKELVRTQFLPYDTFNPTSPKTHIDYTFAYTKTYVSNMQWLNVYTDIVLDITGRTPSTTNTLQNTLSQLQNNLPPEWRAVIEQQHPFNLIALFNQEGALLSQDDTRSWAELLELPTAPHYATSQQLHLLLLPNNGCCKQSTFYDIAIILNPTS